VTVGEIYEGAFNSPNPGARLDTFRRFLAHYRILNLNDPIMERFAEIRAFLRRHGQIISDFDIIIGATALHYDLTVLTFNLRHLQRIPNLRVYQP
jgi:predicted nucleic acid-binding protein